MNEREQAVIDNPELVDSIRRGIAQAHAGQTTERTYVDALNEED